MKIIHSKVINKISQKTEEQSLSQSSGEASQALLLIFMK